jgi:phage I-like protein
MLSELPSLPTFARNPAQSKIERKAKKWGIGVTEFAEETARAATKPERDFAAQIFALSEVALDAFGRQAYKIPVCMTGEWVKGQPFGIDTKTLDTIIRNFEKRGNGEIVVDFDHASENPGIAGGKEVPAAGWLSGLSRETLDGMEILTALFAPTEKAKGLIERQEYRYVSPAIDWGYRDKKSGEPQGATLTSVGLTNQPFLDQLPPLQLREAYRNSSAILMTDLQGGTTMNATEQAKQMRVKASELESQGKKDEAKKLLADAEKMDATVLTMDEKPPRLKLCKMSDGPRKGQFGAFHFDGNSPVGYVTASDAKSVVEDDDDGDEADAEDKKKMAEAIAEFKAAGLETLALSEIRSLIDKGREAVTKEASQDGKRILMSEAVVDGVLDRTKATFAANSHRNISTADYVAVERADNILDKAVRNGKFTPNDRAVFFEDVVASPDKWEKRFGSTVPFFNVGSGVGAPGATDGGMPSVEDRVNAETKRYMNEKKIDDFAFAMRTMLSENDSLRQEYEKARAAKKA